VASTRSAASTRWATACGSSSRALRTAAGENYCTIASSRRRVRASTASTPTRASAGTSTSVRMVSSDGTKVDGGWGELAGLGEVEVGRKHRVGTAEAVGLGARLLQQQRLDLRRLSRRTYQSTAQGRSGREFAGAALRATVMIGNRQGAVCKL
jgi:hypothetical protein